MIGRVLIYIALAFLWLSNISAGVPSEVASVAFAERLSLEVDDTPEQARSILPFCSHDAPASSSSPKSNIPLSSPESGYSKSGDDSFISEGFHALVAARKELSFPYEIKLKYDLLAREVPTPPPDYLSI